ncbi:MULTISPECIES: thioesterase II family protein [Kitasatospora]|uniref:thioesterase II family protein n=1 Tax=Kitasatospora TaxID=2063 RepID=UPI000C709C5B|nr:alpha/beta fold hydrolase [Kitasatospora sp. GP30]MDH6145768.1 pyochelin biosynthetic protein PchC [Kitasatospora sp. GP30]
MAAGTATARWIRSRRPSPAAAVNLVLLPHAGGSAGYYRAWHELMPQQVELHAVQYPGREDRFGEAPLDGMAEMADAVTEAIRPLFSREVVLFGHSMGASIAYEVALRCTAAGLRPRLLIVSGRAAPHRQPPAEHWAAPDAELLAEVRRQSGDTSAALDDPDLRELLLPMIRADYKLAETHRVPPGTALELPIAVLRGRGDAEVDDEQARAWGELTADACSQHVFDGGHFYFEQGPARVIDTVVALVGRALR